MTPGPLTIPIDHDVLVAHVAKAILKTRAKGLSRNVWAYRAAAAAILAIEKFQSFEPAL